MLWVFSLHFQHFNYNLKFLENRGKLPTYFTIMTDFTTWSCIEYISPWSVIDLITLEVIWTDCTNKCKYNYHTNSAIQRSNNFQLSRSYFNKKCNGNCALCKVEKGKIPYLALTWICFPNLRLVLSISVCCCLSDV